MNKPVKYIAILLPGDNKFTWFDAPVSIGRGNYYGNHQSVRYVPTGEFIQREDFEKAEIYRLEY